MMLIDTHAHLDYSDFAPDLDQVIERARSTGVTRIITIGTNIESSHRAVSLAKKYSSVYAVIGIHPTEVHTANGDSILELEKLAQQPRVVAIGETGLDYHHLPSEKMASPFKDVMAVEVMQDPAEVQRQLADDDYKNCQADIFRAQLDLATELGLNVVIHQRDAWQDTLNLLESYIGKLRGVFHCFGGDIDQANEVIAKGHLVSFTGIVTFKNAKVVQETATRIASDQFMVETDCPYLAPIPHRGKRCEPAYTRLVAEKLAELRQTTLETIALQTTTTAEAFFKFNRQ